MFSRGIQRDQYDMSLQVSRKQSYSNSILNAESRAMALGEHLPSKD